MVALGAGATRLTEYRNWNGGKITYLDSKTLVEEAKIVSLRWVSREAEDIEPITELQVSPSLLYNT